MGEAIDPDGSRMKTMRSTTRRGRHWTDVPLWREVSAEQWSNWKWQLQHSIKTLAERAKHETMTLLCKEATDEKCHRRLLKGLIEQRIR